MGLRSGRSGAKPFVGGDVVNVNERRFRLTAATLLVAEMAPTARVLCRRACRNILIGVLYVLELKRKNNCNQLQLCGEEIDGLGRERLRCLGPTPGTGTGWRREKNCAWWWPLATPGLAWEPPIRRPDLDPPISGSNGPADLTWRRIYSTSSSLLTS